MATASDIFNAAFPNVSPAIKQLGVKYPALDVAAQAYKEQQAQQAAQQAAQKAQAEQQGSDAGFDWKKTALWGGVGVGTLLLLRSILK